MEILTPFSGGGGRGGGISKLIRQMRVASRHLPCDAASCCSDVLKEHFYDKSTLLGFT